MSFLDPLIPAYTHGVHGHDEEPLATALVRKFEFAIVRCGLEAGKTVLDIGPRWGAFTAYALQAGVSLTGLTSSEASLSHLKSKFGGFGSRFRIMLGDILNYDTNEKFRAIISPTDNGRGILRPTKATCSAHSATSSTESFAFISGEQLTRSSRASSIVTD
jgi:cyclopropane fatty-acyl-phospholipid synthase-like methyltransferase